MTREITLFYYITFGAVKWSISKFIKQPVVIKKNYFTMLLFLKVAPELYFSTDGELC